ncbi:hypothetical protein B7H23_06405 [Notoacmeibacter marinus]|uniref:Uncharacterized protein n=2 Tax=Notoacmeibacter marinus TaxID=1876515 RepID=A0A231V443_9HYPH|nr:hypothetical protein B7H23_06405 [Notoacmeibacter marinus]
MLALSMIRRGEKRLGVTLDYVREIAKTDFGLLMRYNRLFGFLDPNRHAPKDAYHVARIRGACVEVEINLARQSGMDDATIDRALTGQHLTPDLQWVCRLADATVRDRTDDTEAREAVRAAYGDPGLIELAYAMNGAAILPGIKRALGYATACNIETMRRLAKAQTATRTEPAAQ